MHRLARSSEGPTRAPQSLPGTRVSLFKVRAAIELNTVALDVNDILQARASQRPPAC